MLKVFKMLKNIELIIFLIHILWDSSQFSSLQLRMNFWCCFLSKYDSSDFSQSSTFAPEVSSTMLEHRTTSESEIIGQHDATPLITYDRLTTTLTLTCHCCSLVHNARPTTIDRVTSCTINDLGRVQFIDSACLPVRPSKDSSREATNQPTSHEPSHISQTSFTTK